MSLAEFNEWQLYAELEPFGSHYDDLRAGAIASATYNVNRDPKRRMEAFGPLDFLPWNDVMRAQAEKQGAAPMTPAEVSDRMRALLGFRQA